MTPQKYNKGNTCQAHCPSCGLCFASQKAFDEHLGGERYDWDHLEPSSVKNLRCRTRKGMCKYSYEESRTGRLEGVEIWEHGPEADRLAERVARGLGPGK